MKDKNKMAVLYSLLALAIFSLALAFALSPYPLETIIQLAKAAETAEERAHEQQHNGSNVENGFSPVSPELSKEVTNQSKRVTINLSPQSLIQSGSPLQGNPSAPITIVEFGDFQCEFCGRFAKETEPKINATYIQTGKANMIFKNFVTHGPDSITAAMERNALTTKVSFGIFITHYTKIKEERILAGLMQTI